MMVTGGLGGLGLIASFHCAAEYDNPVITTSRSGKLGTGGGANAFNMYESMREIVPVYNARLDVSKAKDTHDMFAWISRPALPPEDSKLFLDDILNQLKYKMNSMPDDALRLLQEFLVEVKGKLAETMHQIRSSQTKLDPVEMNEMMQKEANVAAMISALRSKVGVADRTGRCRLQGGVGIGSYSIDDESVKALQGEAPRLPASEGPKGSTRPSAISGADLSRIMREEMGLMQKSP